MLRSNIEDVNVDDVNDDNVTAVLPASRPSSSQPPRLACLPPPSPPPSPPPPPPRPSDMFEIKVNTVTYPRVYSEHSNIADFSQQVTNRLKSIFLDFIDDNDGHCAMIDHLVGDILEDEQWKDVHVTWRWRPHYRHYRTFDIVHPFDDDEVHKASIEGIEPKPACWSGNIPGRQYQCLLLLQMKVRECETGMCVTHQYDTMSVRVVITPRLTESLKTMAALTLTRSVKTVEEMSNLCEKWVRPAGLDKLLGKMTEFTVEPDTEEKREIIQEAGGKCYPRVLPQYLIDVFDSADYPTDRLWSAEDF